MNGQSTTRHLQWLLGPLSVLYGGIIQARNARYDRLPSSARHVGIPVISIGNITVGGTGKTPLVIEVVRRLASWGRRPAILTRGYRAAPGETADEVREFQTAVGAVPVVVDPDRVRGAATAQRKHNADCAVLDDGFQHRRIGRDLDIVLIDALQPWGGEWVLPAGRLREPLANLRRADLLIITRTNQVDRAAVDAIAGRLNVLAPAAPVLTSAVVPDALVFADDRRELPAALADQSFVGVCGLGNPSTFEQLLAGCADAPQIPVLRFADHQHYNAGRVREIVAFATQAGAAWVVTTRKDWVKLRPLWPDDGPALARLDVRVTLTGGAGVMDARLRRAVGMTSESDHE